MKKLGSSLLAVCLLAAVACGRGEKSQDEISETLKDKGTTEVLKAAADDKYTPPADGRLTDAQIQMYLKVREREKEIARVAREEAQSHAKKAETAGEKSVGGMMEAFKTLGSVADLATADIRAAQELGYNSAEYLWIKTTILGVSSADVSQQLVTASTAMMDASYVQLKKQYDAATDPTTKKAIADALAQYDKSRTEMAKQAEEQKDPAYEYNKQLIMKYEGTINALATELAKYSDTGNAGDLNKQMSDFQKAAADAQAKAQSK
ncbi:MAG: hypothetical protein HYU52_02055 [Acidobacteria bacterium]|nr:hypothetical protein [Acidobacteriota bacterium]